VPFAEKAAMAKFIQDSRVAPNQPRKLNPT
jgi:hypothetical protein